MDVSRYVLLDATLREAVRMDLIMLGPSLYGQGGTGVFTPRVATIFPRQRVLVTCKLTHIEQHQAMVEWADQQRAEQQLTPMTEEERDELFYQGVDLIIHPETIHIRPDADHLDLVFEADELLQEQVSKLRIRFMLAGNEPAYRALKGRGECWRITPGTMSSDEMVRLIKDSQMTLGGRLTYYHSPSTGTRMLTIQALRGLEGSSDEELRNYLLEMQEYASKKNRKQRVEVDFFLGSWPLHEAFRKADFVNVNAAELRRLHRELCGLFAESVKPHLRIDDTKDEEWRRQMCQALRPLQDDVIIEEAKLGLASEFHRHVEWLPGGRIEDGLLVFDPIYKVFEKQRANDELRLQDQRARMILCNVVRDNPDLEYVNIGRVAEPLGRGKRRAVGRREVYVLDMKQRGSTQETVKIIYIQKWDVRWRLDQGVPMEQAMIDTEEYTEYTLDRRLGCHRLGMNLGGPITVGKVSEIYQGNAQFARHRRIWTTYFERDYVRGIASDKVPRSRFQSTRYTRAFARLLGRAAATNLIVGRGGSRNEVFFDDGDEVIIENSEGFPVDLIVTHHTGSFWHYRMPLAQLAPPYAEPVNQRLEFLADPQEFGNRYLTALIDRFVQLQQDYRDRRAAFDRLFHFREINPAGSFAHRWENVLRRLDQTDPEQLRQIIRDRFSPLLKQPSCKTQS